MYISCVYLKGYRNFKEATVNFANKTLVIGSNDVGKSNLVHALRILLDKSLSDAHIEPQESDFYIHEDTNELEIRLEFEEVTQDCVIAKLRENISDDGKLILGYKATRTPETGALSYALFAGHSVDAVTEIESRFYLRVLNLKFIGSRRDLRSFVKVERKRLLYDARTKRTEEETEQDVLKLSSIRTKLGEVKEDVSSLTYVANATQNLNSEMQDLSHHHGNFEIVFDTGESDPSLFVDNLNLAGKIEGKTVTVGGDGRNSQIHLALWSSRNRIENEDDEPLEVNIFCIEEPEIHLHPHQQRKLAKYLSEKLSTQVIITSHSPQIACEFSPDSVVRLFDNKPDTKAAGNGVNPFIESEFIKFGHRLSIIPAEAFFAGVVLLVEGVSEEIFYKALASQINIDIDKYNISILMVDGVGFKPYASLLSSLEIPFVIRTDNDIFKIPKKDEYRFAGVQRAVDLYKLHFQAESPCEELDKLILEKESKLTGFGSATPPDENKHVADQFAQLLSNVGIFLANIDLEHDLNDQLGDITAQFYGEDDDAEIVKQMQKRKGVAMFEFVKEFSDELSQLRELELAKPLYKCQAIVVDNDETNDGTTENN